MGPWQHQPCSWHRCTSGWPVWRIPSCHPLLSCGSSSNKSLGVNQFLEGDSDSGWGLGSINLVVGTDVLQDGLSGGSLLVTKSLDSCLDHGSIRWVGSRGLRLGRSLLCFWGCGVSGHDDCCSV